MKRSALSLAVAAALAGVAGSATAQTATTFVASQSEPGHHLVVPYYSTQNGNNTLINLVNTDTVNGKAVKVRFRGASNSDDFLDFQVLMSPGDMWSANVATVDGVPRLTTSDNSCTIPSTVRTAGVSFLNTRIDQAGLSQATKNNELREGYIEILTMADIPTSTNGSATNIFTAIKHNASGIAPCTVSVLEGTDGAGGLSNLDSRLGAATAGLFGNWTVINVASTRAFAGEATALRGVVGSTGAAGTLANVYYRQSNAAAAGSGLTVSNLTADPLLTTGAVTAQVFDFPDLSTPSLSGATNPTAQANAVSAAIDGFVWASEFLSTSDANFETDLVLSQPTRRYYVAVDYNAPGAGSTTAPEVVFNTSATSYYATANVELGESVNGVAQACVTGVSPRYFNREEGSPAGQSDIGISPGTPSPPILLCGEVPVVSINGTDPALGVFSPTTNANVTMINVVPNFSSTVNGWVQLTTPGANSSFGLPIIANQFSRAFNPAVSAGTSGNFGARWNMRIVRQTP